MRQPRIPSILGVACLVLVAALAPTAASAEVSLSVSPALLDLNGGAGSDGQVAITVANRGDEAIDVVTDVGPLDGAEQEPSAVEWSSVSPDRLRLAPDEETDVLYHVTIPKDAVSGGRYAAVSLSTVPPDADEGADVSGRIIVPVLLTVTGRGPVLREPSLDRAALFVELDGRIGLRAEVSNAGNTHVLLEGAAVVREAIPAATSAGTSMEPAATSEPGAELARLALVTGRVLPEVVRTYASADAAELPDDLDYVVRLTMAPPADAGISDVEPLTMRFEVEPTAALAIASLGICQGDAGGPTIAARLDSSGGLGVVSNVAFEISDTAGVPLVAANLLEPALAWPGSTSLASIDLPTSLAEGDYVLVATATSAWDDPAESSLPFRVGADPASALPAC